MFHYIFGRVMTATFIFITILIPFGLLLITTTERVAAEATPQQTYQKPSSPIPIGKDSYKITVYEDGIYELTYATLQAHGMDVDQVDPTTFEMMHLGEPLSYQFVGDGDNKFEPDEAIRFYGWAFDGSEHDKLFVDYNVYWLWAGGSSSQITSRANETGHPPVTQWRSTIVFEEDLNFSFTGSNDWEFYDFEATPWYWARMASNPIGWWPSWMNEPYREYDVTIPDPVPDGADAQLISEVLSHCTVWQVTEHEFEVGINGVSHVNKWHGRIGKRLVQLVPSSALLDGTNKLRVEIVTPQKNIQPTGGTCALDGSFSADLINYNRSILTYSRHLSAINDQLIFTYKSNGSHQFQLDNFTTDSVPDALVWDISEREHPIVITLGSADITANQDGTFNWSIGDTHTEDAQYIVTTAANILSPSSIDQYVAPDLVTADIEWIAISHSNFMPQAERLMQYRLDSGMQSAVVDVADVIDQYGYGYNRPQSIQAYLYDGYTNWAKDALYYAVLFGDATMNPHKLECIEVCKEDLGGWSTEYDTFIVTDLQFYDRFSGFVVTDHTYADLINDGSYTGSAPELAVGRFAVNTLEEAKNSVDKVILYEKIQENQSDQMNRILFLADNADSGGNFCETSRLISQNSRLMRPFSEKNVYCFDDYLQSRSDPSLAKDKIRTDVMNEINGKGVAIVNFNGHGTRPQIGRGIINANHHLDLFQNQGQPVVWINSNCLDGDFAYPTEVWQSLSERMLRMGDLSGTAGHWAATGLGFEREQRLLHQGFYEGLYQTPAYRIGEAIIYSKTRYLIYGYGNTAQIWSYTYQGDPAMIMPFAQKYTGQNYQFLPFLSQG